MKRKMHSVAPTRGGRNAPKSPRLFGLRDAHGFAARTRIPLALAALPAFGGDLPRFARQVGPAHALAVLRCTCWGEQDQSQRHRGETAGRHEEFSSRLLVGLDAERDSPAWHG